MSLIKSMRRQRAIWWQRGEPDEFGSFTFGEPIQIKCRWEDKLGEFRSETGQTMPSVAVVYVDREMKPGDKLMHADLESDTPLDPRPLAAAFEIQAFEVLPNLRAKEFLYTAHL